MVESSSGRYLTFDLGEEVYAVEVERVEVVLESVPITRVPKSASHLRGVINYRGSVIPVADLRMRFGAAVTPEREGGSIVVLNLRFGDADITMGILADAVREVIDIDSSKIDRAPRLGNRADDGLIAGIFQKDGGFVVLLDIDRAFAMTSGSSELGASRSRQGAGPGDRSGAASPPPESEKSAAP